LIKPSLTYHKIQDRTDCKKLTDKEGYRIRVADYRILYTIDDRSKMVVVYRIKIRGKDTYK